LDGKITHHLAREGKMSFRSVIFAESWLNLLDATSAKDIIK